MVIGVGDRVGTLVGEPLGVTVGVVGEFAVGFGVDCSVVDEVDME